MARRVFFSFHYERDIWRAGQVRNSWVTKPDREDAGFFDKAAWEAVQRQGEEAVKAWIRRQLEGTTVTVVLIGAETASRPYVRYEIVQSWGRKNGLIGVRIHNIKDTASRTDVAGADPFAGLYSNLMIYDWVSDKGYANLGEWVEAAYQRAQKRT